jgi:hypothetical protein
MLKAQENELSADDAAKTQEALNMSQSPQQQPPQGQMMPENQPQGMM